MSIYVLWQCNSMEAILFLDVILSLTIDRDAKGRMEKAHVFHLILSAANIKTGQKEKQEKPVSHSLKLAESQVVTNCPM